jgi:hypothetical protein
MIERIEEVVRENERLRLALDRFHRDPHQASTRPCRTCEDITRLIGEPFHCVAARRVGLA